MSDPPNALKAVAHVANESRHYTEVRIAELEHAMNRMQHKQELSSRQHLSQRLAVHTLGLTLALVATLATLGLAVPTVIKLGMPFMPSLAIEVIDRYLRF